MSIKFNALSPAQSHRCEQWQGPGVECDADVLSGDSVLGQSVFRSRQAILGQVILSEGWAFRSCQSYLLHFLFSQMSLFAPILIIFVSHFGLLSHLSDVAVFC